MNSSAGKGLKANPFVTVRDPQTGQWQICKPDDNPAPLNRPKPDQPDQPNR
jgi:hypothetical protein